MSHSVARSYQLYERAQQLIPGGTQLISRRPSRFAPGVSPVYAASAKGARFTDVDGNEYIDWASGIGSIILGFADPVIDEAVKKQIEFGAVTSINHELEIELAEEVVKKVPCAEMVRYAKCGGEACAMAVRIARGATGRDKVLFCGYHGWHDWYLAANLDAGESLDAHLFPGIEPAGVPAGLKGTAIPFPYGDIEALTERLDRNAGEIAAIMMEPFRSDEPPEGYLAAVRELARKHGAVLIFDEVSTGIRYSPGGVQPFAGVAPDMAVFAKSISNGYPMGIVAGSRAVMEPAGRMFISSTYWSDPIGMRAALTTLRELEKRRVPDQLRQTGATLKAGLNQIAEETGAPVCCSGIDTHPHLAFACGDAEKDRILATLYVQEMAKRGCHGYPAFYLNGAQGPSEIEQTLSAAREVFSLLCQDDPVKMLDCEIYDEPFRRLVK